MDEPLLPDSHPLGKESSQLCRLSASGLCHHHLAFWFGTYRVRGLISVFSATKRKARGYRSSVHLLTMLYFVAGKLRLPQF